MHVYTIENKYSLVLAIFIRTNKFFKIFCQFEQAKMAKFHRIYKRIVFNACVEYQEEICIGVGDIHLDGKVFQIFCQFELTKIAMSRPL